MPIPDELHGVKQWTVSFDQENLKRPRHAKYRKGGALTYESALRQAGGKLLTGFYVTVRDPYILGDLDHIEDPANPFGELPVALAALLQEKKPYAESSPSGKGVRFLLRLADEHEKQALEGNVFYTNEADEKRAAQINIGPPWMTITGNELPWSSGKIPEVTLDELAVAFTLKYKDKKKQDLVEKEDAGRTTGRLPPLTDVKVALMSLAMDQNPRIKRAYKKVFNAEYQHYDYWLKVLMALHDFAVKADKMVECVELAIEWSKTDKAAFSSEEDVTSKWRSFKAKTENVSYKTLFGLWYRSVLVWPKAKKRSKEEKERGAPRKPLITEYVNFKELLNHFDINLLRDCNDKNIIYITGDEDILEKYFGLWDVEVHYGKYWGPLVKDTLVPGFHIMCQDYDFLGISHTGVLQFIRNRLAETTEEVNLSRVYFDTPFEQLPDEYKENEARYDISTPEYMFEALTIDYLTENHNAEKALYSRYYECWLMGFVRNLYWPSSLHTNNCILLLTGKEQIRKTSHFRFLLPSFMRGKIAFPTHGFSDEGSMRDLAKIGSQNLIMVWDEIEHVLNQKTESNFKKVLDNIPQTAVDKYEVVPTVFRPITIYGATSNLREFKLGQEGSRRLFHIPVSWVDTDRINSVNWHGLVLRLRGHLEKAMAKGETPWLLNERELEYQMALHTGIRAKTGLDYILSEAFEFENESISEAVNRGQIPDVGSIQKPSQTRVMTTKEVFDKLSTMGYHVHNMGYPAMEKTLERMCGDYTGTRRESKDMVSPKCTLYKGRAVQGPHKKWVMPPAKETDVFKDK